MHVRLGIAAAGCILSLPLGVSLLHAFQGMATPPASNRRPPAIETNLPPIAVDFRDIAQAAGLSASDVSGSLTQKKYILETTGQGVAVFDYNNDGLPDIFLVNATTLDPAQSKEPTNHLYRNLGNLKFQDVT